MKFKNLWKIISADAKAKVTTTDATTGKRTACCIIHFYNKYLQNLKYTVIRVFMFHLILIGIPSRVIFPIKNMGGGGFYLRAIFC